jgi:hypothetical protein
MWVVTRDPETGLPISEIECACDVQNWTHWVPLLKGT